MSRLTIASVSYLNAKPLLEGLDREADVLLDVPSRLESMLRDGRADVALLPVADVPGLSRGVGVRVLRAGCIGCDGPTLTVRVFSDRPMNAVETLYADTDSHTSVNLARVVFRELFGRDLRLQPLERRPVPAGHGRAWPEGAVLLIGDKVIVDAPPPHVKPVQMDLGEAWKQLTGLPFVFAVWTARAGVDVPRAEEMLARARCRGLEQIESIVSTYAPRHGWPVDLARRYLTQYLRFEVGERQLLAMRLFWEKAGLGEACAAMP